MKRRKVVYIAQSAGGVAEYLYMLLKNLDSEKNENILIVSQDYEKQIERFKPYVQDIFVVHMERNINFKSDLKAIVKIRKILKLIKPDIVYLHSSKAGAIGRIALLLNHRAKIIYNAHGWYFNAKIGNKKKKVFARIEKLLAYKTDMIVNISENEYESAIENKIANPKKMCIIRNGIDFTKFNNNEKKRNDTRSLLSIDENEIIIGVVGRISEQKDPITMIKAFYNISNKYKNVKLMFVGSGELEKNVKEYAVDNGIEDKIIITGWISNVENYIPAFDIAVLPSKWEGFGLAIIEYMICDKPIVASNVGGIGNIIKDKENGLLFEKGNYNELSERIIYLIENKDFVDKIVKNNKNYREEYSIKRVINEHKKILKI